MTNNTTTTKKLDRKQRKYFMILGYLVSKGPITAGSAAEYLGVSLKAVVHVAELHGMNIDVAVGSGGGIYNLPVREWVISHE